MLFVVQLLFAGCVNSNNSLRLAGRGGGTPTRGGRGGRGRGEGCFVVFFVPQYPAKDQSVQNFT